MNSNTPAPPKLAELSDAELRNSQERINEELRHRERKRERAMQALGPSPAGWLGDDPSRAGRQLWRTWRGAGNLSYCLNMYMVAESCVDGRVAGLPKLSLTVTYNGEELRAAELAGNYCGAPSFPWPAEGRTLAETCAWADELMLRHMRAELAAAEKKVRGEC